MAKYRFATEGKWSTAANWNEIGKETTHKVPGENDDATFDGTSPKCEISVEAKCRSIEASAYTKTLKLNSGITLRVGAATANGTLALKFSEAMTFESAGAAGIIFGSTSATVLGVTTGKQKMGEAFFNNAGSWKLEDSWDGRNSAGSTTGFSLEAGTLNTNGQTVEKVGTFSATGSTARVLKLGASKIKCKGWMVETTGLTFEAGTSVIEVGNGTFSGGGLSYATVTKTEAGDIAGSNTIATLKINANTKLKEGTTQTLEKLETSAKSGEEFKLESTKAGTAAKFKKAATNVNVDWLKITDVETDNAVSWFAGANSTLSGLTEFWKKEAEGGTTTAQCKAKLTLVDTASVAVQAQGQAKAKIVVGDAASVRMLAQAQEQARLALMGTAQGVAQARVGAIATYSFGGRATVQVMTVAQAIARLTLSDAATANALMQVGARAKVVVADKATASQIQQVAGKATLIFGGRATASTGTSTARHHVSIFIFEDE